MAALDFPSSPTDGQVYGQYTYDATKGAWRVASSQLATIISSPTAPVSPVAGNMWLNTNDGTLYVYYDDGNTAQWIEARSEISTSKLGLVPVVPTSITLGSGTGSISSTGLVTFSGATTVALNGCFTSAFKNYKVIFRAMPLSGSANLSGRFRTAGTDYSGAGYSYAGAQSISTGMTNVYSVGLTSFTALIGYGTVSSLIEMTVTNPQLAVPTNMNIFSNGHNGNGNQCLTYAGIANVTNQFDGFNFIGTASTFTGEAQVYGYN